MQLRARKANPLLARVLALDDEIADLDHRLAANQKKPQPIPARPAKQAQPRAAKKTSKRTRAEAEEEEEEDERDEEPVARRGPAEPTTSGGRLPLGHPTLYVGERPVTHGWRPNAPDAQHPSSPVNFFFYLEEKGIRTDNAYILRNALAKSKYPHSILDFVKDPVYAFDWIDKHVSKKQSVYSKANVARAVTVALDHRLKWPPLLSVDDPTRVKWNEELNRFDGDSFRYNEALSAKTLDLHLEDVRNLVRDYYSGKDEWERHGKWALLFYAYLFFAPFRDDWTACKIVQKREDCTNPKTNYLICPNLNDDSQNLSFFLQDSKTFGADRPQRVGTVCGSRPRRVQSNVLGLSAHHEPQHCQATTESIRVWRLSFRKEYIRQASQAAGHPDWHSEEGRWGISQPQPQAMGELGRKI